MSGFVVPDFLVSNLRCIVGSDYVRVGSETEPFLKERRGLFRGRCACVVLPGSTREVVQVMRFAHENTIPVVPQGGNTGLVGGQTPCSVSEIVLSLSRLNGILEIDDINGLARVEAGVTLETLRGCARRKGLLFPLSLPSKSECQVGGVVSTNAGGVGVIRYGMMRDLVLGLEVVLPNGDVLDLDCDLVKRNDGYDIKQLFVGSEGTLGIITKANLRLFAKPACQLVAILSVRTTAHALGVLRMCQKFFANNVSGFEIISREVLEIISWPLSVPPDDSWAVLVEISGSDRGHMTKMLEGVLHAHAVSVYEIAEDEGRGDYFWQLRSGIPDAQGKVGVSIKHDIGILPSKMEGLVEHLRCVVRRRVPNARFLVFGHLGDGNLHFNVMQPEGYEGDFRQLWGSVSDDVHRCVISWGGTISAEHGIGQLKRELLPLVHSPQVLSAMKALKGVFDPRRLLNPGKVLA